MVMGAVTRLARGLAALATLVVLLVGIPALLWQLGGNPLPSSVPSVDDITSALGRQENGDLVLLILSWVGWAGWASFALSVLVEIPAQLRGLHAPRLPAMQLQQAGAKVLVGAVLGIFSVGAVTGGAHAATAPSSAASTPTTATASATVHPPATAPVTSPTATPTAGEGQATSRTVTVEQGDTLSGIAKDELGTGAQWPALFEASKGAKQPGGARLTNPDRIQPGWTITIPSTKTTAPEKPAPQPRQETPKPAPETTAPSPAPPAPEAAPKTAPPAAAVPSAPSAERPGTGAAPSPQTSGARPLTATIDADTQQVTGIGTSTGLAAAAAAGVLGLLGARRTIQTRRRAPGRRIAMPTGDAAQTETQLRADADTDPLATDDLDLAMRTLAHVVTTAGGTVPQLTAARIQPGQLELYLPDLESDLPDPFTRVAAGVWSVPRDGIGALLDVDDAAEVPAPYPSLVTLGQDEEAAWVLLHLEQAKALAVTGPDADQVLPAMLLELISSGWADDLRVTLVDLLPDLADAFGSDRVSHVTDLDQVLTAAEYAAAVHTTAMTDHGLDDPAQARATGQLPDVWTPQLLVLAQPPTAQQRDRIQALLEAVPRLSIAVLTTNQHSDPLSPWTLTTTSDGAATLLPTGIELTPQRLDQATYAQLVDVLRTTDQPDTPGPQWATTLVDEPGLDTIPAAPPGLIDLTPPPTHPTSDADTDAQTDTPQAGTDPGSQPEAESETDDGTTAGDGDTTTSPTDPVTTHEGPAEPTAHEHTEDPQATPADVDEHPLHRPAPIDTTRPLVRLLGPIEIQHAPGKRPASPGKAAEIVAFLALHPSTSHEPLDAAIWPGKRITAANRNVPISNARSWLGTAPDGHPYVSLVDDAGYTLADDTQVDWWLFQGLVGDDISAADPADLQAALKLVAGTPLTMATRSTRTPLRALAWAEADMQEMVQAIADVAHDLSTRALLERDPTTAAWAAAKGLAVEPASEILWRDALRAAWQSGITGRVEAVADQLTDALEPLGDIDPETHDLMTDLIARAHHTQRRAS